MKVDFSELWRQVERISTNRVEWEWTTGDTPDPIDIELDSGLQIQLDQLDVVNGLLAIQGRQVLLYIPDQYHPLETVKNDPAKGNRFHVADCDTLNRMRTKGRFERYFVTNNLSGEFEISGRGPTGRNEEATTPLLICRHCLTKLNYKNYAHGGRKSLIWRNFEIAEFFETYSTNFRYLPTNLSERSVSNEYTEDWTEISQTIRNECGFQCDECNVDLSEHQNRRLLHVHHINGVRTDNRRSNLRPLCADCHRKQPMHGRMFISSNDMSTLTRLRRQQRVSDSSDWDGVLKLADTAAHGALYFAQRQGFEPPEIGYEFVDARGAVITHVEAAWPDRRIAIYVSNPPEITDWTMYSTAEFLEASASG